MWHITLPSIKPTIVVMLIMGVGGMLNADSDMILLLYSPATYEYADVIGTYLYRYGLVGGNFSYGTAVGLFISLINFGLMFLANKVSRRVADYCCGNLFYKKRVICMARTSFLKRRGVNNHIQEGSTVDALILAVIVLTAFYAVSHVLCFHHVHQQTARCDGDERLSMAYRF